MLLKLVSTVVPVYLSESSSEFDAFADRKTNFKNSINERLVNTILVLSQSNMPEEALGTSLIRKAFVFRTKTSGPVPLFGHVDDSGRSKTFENFEERNAQRVMYVRTPRSLERA